MTICPFCLRRYAEVLVRVKRLHAPVTPACGTCARLPLDRLRYVLIMRGTHEMFDGVLVQVNAS